MTTDATSRSWLSGWRLDGILVATVCLLGLLLLRPGVFSVDESHYLLAAKAMASGQAFHIDNGYEDVRDPSLLFFYTVRPDALDEKGSMSSVPPFHALLATPFLWLGGLSGLIWLNLLAFAASLMAVRRLAEQLLDSQAFVFATLAAFATATFSLEYAFGIWPHATSQAVAAWATVALITAPGARRPGLLLFAAGLLAGMGCGIRLQHMLELPLFLLAALWLMKMRWRSLWILAGFIPPLLAMSLINSFRLGTINPFSYGASSMFAGALGILLHQAWLPLLAATALVATLIFTRKTGRNWAWAVLLLGGLAVVLLLPLGRRLLLHWAGFAGYHLLDSSLLGDISRSVGATANEWGQALYGGVMKKSLLQAAPWLAMAPLVLWSARGETTQQIKSVALVGLGCVLLLPFIASAGGFCFNPRYFVDCLPGLTPLALLVAWRAGPTRPLTWGLGGLLGLGLALPILVEPGSVEAPAGGLYPMLAPLILAGVSLAGGLCALRKGGGQRVLAAGGLAAGLAFAALLHLGLDLPRSLKVRDLAGRMLAVAEPIVQPPAVLGAVGARKDVYSPLKLDRDLWLAGLDPGAEELPPILYQTPKGRAVWLLANGVPAERLRRWLERMPPQRRVERKGLVFLLLREVGP